MLSKSTNLLLPYETYGKDCCFFFQLNWCWDKLIAGMKQNSNSKWKIVTNQWHSDSSTEQASASEAHSLSIPSGVWSSGTTRPPLSHVASGTTTENQVLMKSTWMNDLWWETVPVGPTGEGGEGFLGARIEPSERPCCHCRKTPCWLRRGFLRRLFLFHRPDEGSNQEDQRVFLLAVFCHFFVCFMFYTHYHNGCTSFLSI